MKIGDSLPAQETTFAGRDKDIQLLVDLCSPMHPLLVLTGAPGVGKSALAVALARELKWSRDVTPVYFDLAAVTSPRRAADVMVWHFGLRFSFSELHLFYAWLNSHEQRFLLVLDNLDQLTAHPDLSDFIDQLHDNIQYVRVLCTSSREFFQGQTPCKYYHVDNIHPSVSRDVFTSVYRLPDEDEVTSLTDSLHHNPLAVTVVARTLAAAGEWGGPLITAVTSPRPPPAWLQQALAHWPEEEHQDAAVLLTSLHHALDHVTDRERRLLTLLSVTTGPFSVALATALLKEEAYHVVQPLCALNLLCWDKSRDLYDMSSALRVVLRCSTAGDDVTRAAEEDYVEFYLAQLADLAGRYNSPECAEALVTLHGLQDAVEDALKRVVTMPHRLRCDVTAGRLATMDGAMLLHSVLPSEEVMTFYSKVKAAAHAQEDRLLECRAACCLAYHLLEREQVAEALHQVEPVLQVLQQGQGQPEVTCAQTKAWALLLSGRATFTSDPARGLRQVRAGLDLYRLTLGSARAVTVHACELYATLLVERNSLQMARHFFNVSDQVIKQVLGPHPGLIRGYDARRVIWDKLLLFSRSTDCATRAAQIARLHLRAHPRTAELLSRQVDAILKRGHLTEGLQAAVEALAIRTHTLADHLDTAQAYKTLTYLMLRCGHYEEAVSYGETALEIADKVSADERYLVDLRGLVAQARYRLDYRNHTHYIHLDTRAAKHSGAMSSSGVSSMSTEV